MALPLIKYAFFASLDEINDINLNILYVSENKISYLSAKTYVVGTQKNRLNETVLSSTQNIC